MNPKSKALHELKDVIERRGKLKKDVQKNHSLKAPTPKDKEMSKRHLRDSIRFNLRHAKDHLALADTDEKYLGMQK